MSSWVKELFGTEKPVIAMAHVPALPGTPRYNSNGGIEYLLERVETDIRNLVEAGVDAVMFCNEDDRPYVFEAGIEQIAALTRVVTELAPTAVPFGVDFLWDPKAALAIAQATDAHFIREVLTGVYESDMGLWSPNAGEAMRFRKQIDAEDVRVFYNVVPEFASALGSRTVAERARSAAVSCLADVLLVSGPMAGMEPDLSLFEEIRTVVDKVPIFINTGAKVNNVAEFLQVADGVIVGSDLKVDGYTWNPVDPSRAERFMNEVRRIRYN